MKKYIICFLLIQISFPQINPGEVIWEENFDNLDNWIIETGNGSWGWGNGELQYYTDRSENVVVEDGMLKITAIQESFEGAGYTSARLLTQGLFSQQYGRFEARMKLHLEKVCGQHFGCWEIILMKLDGHFVVRLM